MTFPARRGRRCRRRKSASACFSPWSARCSRCSSAPTSCAWDCRTGGRCPCRRALGQHRAADREQRCAAMGASRSAQHERWTACRPAFLRRRVARSPFWPASFCLAAVDGERLCPRRQSRQQLLLPDHGDARAASRSAGLSASARTTAKAWQRRPTRSGCALEHRALRHLLAFPARRLAGPLRVCLRAGRMISSLSAAIADLRRRQ